MERLNFFNPFKHKEMGQEDPLTRALLILLRYEPITQALFLDLISEALPAHDVPSLSRMNAPLEVRTQVRNLRYASGTLLSVLITDQPISLPEVRWSDRTAVYDGVLNFGDWTFIIESKPDAADVWTEQLSPARTSVPEEHELTLLPHAACLTWQDLFKRLIELEAKDLISATGKLLVQDFLALVDEFYPKLAPYREFALCGDHPLRLTKRCQMLLEQLAAGTSVQVGNRPGRPPYLALDGDIATEAHLLIEDPKRGGAWEVRLDLWPADSVTQARTFFSTVDKATLFGLRDRGWEVRPNLHFSFFSTHLVWATTSLEAEAYFDLCMQGRLKAGQVSAEGGAFKRVVSELYELELISDRDWHLLEEKFLNTARSKVNVIPGFNVLYCWSREEAITLDAQGQFSEQLLTRIQEALQSWKQPFLSFTL